MNKPLRPAADSDPRHFISAVVLAAREARVRWGDGRESRFNFLWLRDNCPSGGDKSSAIRDFSLADVDENLRADRAEAGPDGELVVDWSDGRRSAYSARWLREHCNSAIARRERRERQTLWDSGLQGNWPQVRFADLQEGGDGHLAMLEAVHEYGFCLISGSPVTARGIEDIVGFFGYPRENDFGRVFDLMVEPEVWEMSQSDAPLRPHTDDPYRYAPPGVSVLHCMESGAGGESVLVDGFRVCEELRKSAPSDFEILASTPVQFIRRRRDSVEQGAAVDLRAEARIISLDRDGELAGFRFHERSMAPLDVDPDRMDSFYRALIRLTRMVYDPRFAVRRLLKPGEAIVFDNQRALHGRDGFAGKRARRHLRLCQTDRDQFHSRLRLLRSRRGRGNPESILPAGAMM